MKRIWVPERNRHLVVGSRKRPTAEQLKRFPRLDKFVTAPRKLPLAPDSCDFTPKASSALAQMYMNDQLGCCVIAGYYHVKGVATGNATGTPYIATNDQIVHDYSAIGGYVPGDASTDNGCDEVTAVDYWRQTGDSEGVKILGAVSLDPANVPLLKLGMWLGENHYYGFELPDAWLNPMPTPTTVWDVAGDPDANNGHCTAGAGYAGNLVKLATWGEVIGITLPAIAKYGAAGAGGNVFVIITPDVIAKGQQLAPNGIDWNGIASELEQIGSEVS